MGLGFVTGLPVEAFTQRPGFQNCDGGGDNIVGQYPNGTRFTQGAASTPLADNYPPPASSSNCRSVPAPAPSGVTYTWNQQRAAATTPAGGAVITSAASGSSGSASSRPTSAAAGSSSAASASSSSRPNGAARTTGATTFAGFELQTIALVAAAALGATTLFA